MDRLGLGYKRLKEIKPGIILLSISGFGQTGPWQKEGAIDGIINALSGRIDLTGWPDRGPSTPSVHPYPRYSHPTFGRISIVAALDYKRRTGRGQHMDLAMLEVCASQITPAIIEKQVNSYLPSRNGNRVPYAPRMVYFAVKVMTDGVQSQYLLTMNGKRFIKLWELNPGLRSPGLLLSS